MKVHVDDVKSSFVTFYIFIDMVQYNLTQEQRRYLPLFTDMWIRSPMIKNGTITDIDGVGSILIVLIQGRLENPVRRLLQHLIATLPALDSCPRAVH